MQETTKKTFDKKDVREIALWVLRGAWIVVKFCGRLLWWNVKLGVAVACAMLDTEHRFVAPRLITESFKPKKEQDYDQAWEDGVIAAAMNDDEDERYEY